jgi:NarL family two-component system response regulator YdfI
VRLHITERTVKAHVTGIFNKLGVNSRAEAVAVALRSGLLPAEPRAW